MPNGNPAPGPLNSRYFRPVRGKETRARRWDLQFESTSLQRGVNDEPVPAPRHPAEVSAGAHGEHAIELLAELLSLPSAAADLNASPQRKREMLFEALFDQLESLARDRPVLVIFEDAHWIDPTSRELLDLTFDRVRLLPVLLIVTFRPEFRHPWASP